MRAIGEWSFSKLLVVCAAWVVVSVALLMALLYTWFVSFNSVSGAGSGGVGAVSVGLIPGVFIVVSVLPVIVLLIVWILRKSRRQGVVRDY